MEPIELENWHAKNTSEVLAILKSDLNGLSTIDANHRLTAYGYNELVLFTHTNVFIRFLRQFHNILIYVLLISVIITSLLGYLVDGAVIAAVITVNAIFGFIQEGKAEKAIAGIREMLAPSAQVIRDGKHHTIAAKSLVPGDIVLINSGDKVPADLRLLNAKNLQIQESILTGESNAVEKNSETTKIDATIGDRSNMAYSGTAVTYGKGTGIVVATGLNTEIGKIGTLLENIKPLTTPLLQQINVFGRWLTLAIVLLALTTFLIGVFVWNNPLEQMFMAAVGLAVAAIPEGLPPVLTIILAIGVTRMAKRKAIIRQLPAVETMGAVTTICTDKTGTLTRNEQSIKHVITAQNSYNIEENGAVTFKIDKTPIVLSTHNDLVLAINAIVLCNDAEFSKDVHNKWHIHGNSVDKACLELGSKTKIELHLLQQKFPRSDLIPYESEHKFMATLHHTHDKRGFIYIKGAPEQILSRCRYEKTDAKNNPINIKYWHEQIEFLAKQGYRVLAFAYKEVSFEKVNLLFSDVNDDLILVAIFALIDAPRQEAAQAVEQCHKAGINVKMITGDHAVTAFTIASYVGIDGKSGVLTGSEIDKMTDADLVRKVCDINIYARTSPNHKLRLVQALQVNGKLVAMTGDGVNDAPALRKANIGIAMGHKGAEIAKESADMVLADDNFATIVHAIEEGRVVYDNLRKIILFILPNNAAESFAIVIAIIFGLVLPITPVQILWVNMVTAVTLAVALGFEPGENGVMHRPPRKANASILSKFLVWRVLLVSLLRIACVFGLFLWQRKMKVDLSTARTIAVNMLVLGEVVYLFNCRKIHNSLLNIKALFNSKPVLIAILSTLSLQLLFTYLPVMQRFFGTSGLNIAQWFYIAMLSFVAFVFVEFEKIIMQRFFRING